MLIKWSPMKELEEMTQRSHELLDEFWGNRSLLPSMWKGGMDWPMKGVPSVHVEEDEKAYTLKAEMPGFEQKDITVSINDRVVEIRGEHREEQSDTKKGYTFQAARYGMVAERVMVPESVEASNAQATFKNGCLTITFPKKGKAEGHIIPIKSGGPTTWQTGSEWLSGIKEKVSAFWENMKKS